MGFLRHVLTDLACGVVGVSLFGLYDCAGRNPRPSIRDAELWSWFSGHIGVSGEAVVFRGSMPTSPWRGKSCAETVQGATRRDAKFANDLRMCLSFSIFLSSRSFWVTDSLKDPWSL